MRLGEITEALRAAGCPDPEYDAKALWRAFAGGIFPPRQSDESESRDLLLAVDRRIKREPLQYILGTVGFYREEYEVSEDCLIPRQDTEILVDTALKRLGRGAEILDLCTGSGCVAISAVRNSKDSRAIAVDISEKALEIAKRNALKNGVSERVGFLLLDVLADTDGLRALGKFNAILSNPPYVSLSAYRESQREIFFEPPLAFLGGEDGGDFYRLLVPVLKHMLKKNGFIAFEIGYDQRDLLSSLSKENGLDCEIFKDYSGNDRVALLTARE